MTLTFKSTFYALLFITISSATSQAGQTVLDVRFDEGAPKDRFTFTNTDQCDLKNATITLDLSGSKSGLIFDVTSGGAGVEVFQPLEVVKGKDALSRLPKVKDGDNQIVLSVASLKAGQSIAFTIDVDDTMGGREITVSGSEIEGARVSLATNGHLQSEAFNKRAKTSLTKTICG